jgi:hypothetical protein
LKKYHRLRVGRLTQTKATNSDVLTKVSTTFPSWFKASRVGLRRPAACNRRVACCSFWIFSISANKSGRVVLSNVDRCLGFSSALNSESARSKAGLLAIVPSVSVRGLRRGDAMVETGRSRHGTRHQRLSIHAHLHAAHMTWHGDPMRTDSASDLQANRWRAHLAGRCCSAPMRLDATRTQHRASPRISRLQ